MLVSVGIAVILTYPTVFLSDFPITGFSGLPHHVWASHKPYGGTLQKAPDLEMRQIWIRGSYMKALDKDVLKKALDVQDAILGQAVDLPRRPNWPSSRIDWGWHSPLMYWNNSVDALENDQNVLETINEHSCQPSFLNITLRPLSVFAGKEYSGSKLAAADALIISLFTQANDTMGVTWHQSLLQLESQTSSSTTEYHMSGSVEGNRLFEYRFQPLSFRQNSALAIAYGIIAIYVAISLRRLKAFHSRFGLVVTALTQITTSIVASFTICGLLGINLAQIPQEAYPFVVLVIGLENIFRFINAVLAYPPEMMNTQRIANGLGDIGMASVASAGQNLLILWVMSMVVSPGVAAFCVFAAVALLFDYFFLFTFFLAVLSVDIRRLELQDSLRLSRGVRTRVKKKPRPERHSWVDALIQGKVPFSTRMAGSVVTISFVLVLNWHFTDHSNATSSFRAFPGLFEKQGLPTTEFDGAPALINQTMHPDSWLRTQDYESAVHFMDAVKPGAYGFTARIYDPLVITLAGSDRTGIPLQRSWLSALRAIALQHFYPVAMAAVFVVAFVTVLMNFLLWDDRAEGADPDAGNGDSPPLTVEAVQTSHHLDIIKIAGCRQGHIISAGIDRSISIALYDYKTNSYSAALLGSEEASIIRWPVQDCIIDGPSEWMALVCDNGQLVIGALAKRKFSHNFQLRSEEKVLAHRFIPPYAPTKGKERGAIFVAMHADGSLSECNTADDTCENIKLVQEEICAARFMIAENSITELVVQDAHGRIISYRRSPSGWNYHTSRAMKNAMRPGTISSLASVSGVEGSFLCTPDEFVLLNPGNSDCLVLPSGPVPPAKPASLNLLYSGRGKCGTCKSNVVDSLSFAYNSSETKDCIVQTLTSAREDGRPLHTLTQDKLCDCLSLREAEKAVFTLKDPGAWEASAEAVLGLRQRPEAAPQQTVQSGRNNVLRRRRQNTNTSQTSIDDSEQWEAYLFTASGELHTVPVDTNSISENHLYATRAGPAHRIGPRAVAVALGSTIYVIHHNFERMDSGARRVSDGSSHGMSSRRRLINRKGH